MFTSTHEGSLPSMHDDRCGVHTRMMGWSMLERAAVLLANLLILPIPRSDGNVLSLES